MSASTSMSNNHDAPCDLRLSRAALELVRRHLEASLHPTVAGDRSFENLLQASGLQQQSPYCPLRHSRMEEGFILSMPPNVTRSLFATPAAFPQFVIGSHPRQWYRCGHCGKSFLTRFYLDQHLEHTHRQATTTTTLPNQTQSDCPSDWCDGFLSPQACHDVALEIEPYYGRGSDRKYGRNAARTRHALVQQANRRPCQESNMQQLQSQCEQVIRECFSSESIVHQLNQSLCQALSCHHRLHRLVDQESLSSLARRSKEWADVYSQHHQMGILAMVGLVLFVLVYVRCGFGYIRQSLMSWMGIPRHPQKSSRLLSKVPSWRYMRNGTSDKEKQL